MKITLIACGFVFLGLVGCLERKEKMVIRPDGSVQVFWEVSGDEDDAKTGLKLPGGSGWKEQESVEEKNQKKNLRYTAENTFSSVEEYQKALDARFLPPDIQIKTSLERLSKSTHSNDATYYHFKRTYSARDFLKFEQLRKKNVNENLSKRVSEQGLKDLTQQEQKQFLQGLARFECEKRILLVRDALGQMALEHSFPIRLLDQTETQLLSAYEQFLNSTRLEFLLQQIQQLEEAKNNKDDTKQKGLEEQLTQQLAQIESEFAQAEERTLQQEFQQYPQLPYRDYLKKVKTSFELTEDLSDERFEVRVELPGRLLYTNGTKFSQDQRDSVLWEFEGKQFNNCQIVLEAVSMIEKE